MHVSPKCVLYVHAYKLKTGLFSLSVGDQLDPEQTGFIAVENFTSLAEHHELQLDPSKLEMLLALVQSNEHGHVCYQELIELVSRFYLYDHWETQLCLQVTMLIKWALLRKIAPTSPLDLPLMNVLSMCWLVMGTCNSICASSSSQCSCVAPVIAWSRWMLFACVCSWMKSCSQSIIDCRSQLCNFWTSTCFLYKSSRVPLRTFFALTLDTRGRKCFHSGTDSWINFAAGSFNTHTHIWLRRSVLTVLARLIQRCDTNPHVITPRCTRADAVDALWLEFKTYGDLKPSCTGRETEAKAEAMNLKGFGWSVNLGHEGDGGNGEKKEESVRNPAYME